ncbi:MAG: nucleotidyl transferase AbiEii/AbiGii toxin family protein [Candidatus Berkiella sp.]
MIDKSEIMRFAKQYDLPANTIEKDYILNWLLDGIANSSALNDKWIFKGGTCLKKCYFEEYRFSEDLDFTITDKTHINEEFLLSEFKIISDWIYEESGIEMPEAGMSFEEYANPRGEISIQGIIPYKGPMQRRGNNPTVKLDLTHDELMVNKPDVRKIHHPYSDAKPMQIQTYSMEEIFAEKLRALVERLRPRDLYDVIHLHNDNRWKPDRKTVLETLKKKCDFKGVPVPTMAVLISGGKLKEMIEEWNSMLAHQIAGLEPYEHYWQQLPEVLEWLNK